MLEILFRGKRIDNGEWVYGNLVKSNGKYFIYYEEPDEMSQTGNWLFYKVVDPSTVGQYTGLTDKNGKKIFEGDIVKDEQAQMLGKVVYATAADGFDGMAGFMVDDIDDGLQNYNGFWHLVEVIGNIHDNPELLEGESNV